jgi:molybdopterin/thiamine biosynthesis adenylyltransferase
MKNITTYFENANVLAACLDNVAAHYIVNGTLKKMTL